MIYEVGIPSPLGEGRLQYTGVSVLSIDRAKQWLNDCLDKITEVEKNGYTNCNEETNEENKEEN